jgi:acylglycerol lipase
MHAGDEGPADAAAIVGRPIDALTRDGLRLAGVHWESPTAPIARVLLVHGIAEHGGRYARTATVLAEAGIEVLAFDLRGFGASGGRRAYVRRWDDYLDDVEACLGALPADLPSVLMGHSMGGLIALVYATSGRPQPDLLVLSSPALDTTLPPPVRLAAPLLARVVPTLRVPNALKGEQLSRDPDVSRAYFADPLVVTNSTVRLGAELLAAIGRARDGVQRLHVPTLVIHGGDDTIVPVAASRPLGGLPNVDRRELAGLRHETLNEPEGPEIAAQIAAWIRDRVGAPRAG